MVFVLDKHKKPLMPCSEKRALLERGRARVVHIAPFTIRLVDRRQEDSVLQPLRLNLVQAVIPRGKYMGTWTGRATVKASGQIRIVTSTGVHPTTSRHHCRVLQRGDGWMYTQKPSNPERGQAASFPYGNERSPA